MEGSESARAAGGGRSFARYAVRPLRGKSEIRERASSVSSRPSHPSRAALPNPPDGEENFAREVREGRLPRNRPIQTLPLSLPNVFGSKESAAICLSINAPLQGWGILLAFYPGRSPGLN